MGAFYWTMGVAFGLFLATEKWQHLIIAAVITFVWGIICSEEDDR